MPIGAVRELAFTGRKFLPTEALELGFINKVFDSIADLEKGSLELAQEIASKSPLVTRVIKKQINYARDHSVKEALDYHAAWNSSLISGQDMEAAMKAFIEKSKANYDDLEPTHSFWEKEGLVP